MHDGIILLIGIIIGAGGILLAQRRASLAITNRNYRNIGYPEAGSAVQETVRRPIDVEDGHVEVIETHTKPWEADLLFDALLEERV
ncbi:MAG: hypothetical protein R3320_11100 [Nitriliruptorales bacterium]|nr:hypothetical protein [Nitriliruptorales bacterium]